MNFVSKILDALVASLNNDKSSAHEIPFVWKRAISWVVKLSVSGLAITYILNEFWMGKPLLETMLSLLSLKSGGIIITSILLSALVMMANWGLEMVKWHLLIGNMLNTRWQSAVKGVLSGTTIGVFTPNRMGEFIGRVLALGPSQRITATLLSLVNGLAQSVATLTFGLLAMFILISEFVPTDAGDIGVLVARALLLMLWVLAITLYFQLPRLTVLISRYKILRRWQVKIEALSSVKANQLNRLYILSLIRFVTFIAQYIIVFSFLIEAPNWPLICGISIITLFSNTVLSFLPIPDVVLRQLVALSFFGMFDFDLQMVSLAVFFVWLINVAFPALIGAVVLFSYRIFKSV